jgi:hypothetical protein
MPNKRPKNRTQIKTIRHRGKTVEVTVRRSKVRKPDIRRCCIECGRRWDGTINCPSKNCKGVGEPYGEEKISKEWATPRFDRKR